MSKAGLVRESFVYGLRDPRVEDPILSIRYIGQTAVGLSRPKAHFSSEAALKNDNNKHKAHWIQQLHREGLKPEIVVLERVEDGGLALDVAEQRLVAFYKEAGAELTNIQAGGTSGYVLSAEEKQKISEARSWQPKSGTVERIDVSIVLGPWSREKAWWLGLTYARGSVRDEPGRRHVELRTGSIELAEKWLVLCGAGFKSVRLWSPGCWCVDQGDVRTAKWLIEQYTFHEKWTRGLEWPKDLPEEFVWDFARGLWDAKGHMEFKPRVNRQPLMRTSVESKSWLPAFAETLAARTGGLVFKGVVSVEGAQALGVAARGVRTEGFLTKLYKDVPDSICSVSQRDRALAVCAQWAQVQRPCAVCGVAVFSSGLCKACVKRKWLGQRCACGAEVIVAFGLCSTCYQAERSRRRKDWGQDTATRARLESYDIMGWQGASLEEQAQRLDELVLLYRSRGFPWFSLDEPSAEGVLAAVTKGKLTVLQDSVRAVSSVGQTLCSKAHSHRLRASYRGNPSVVEAFEDDTKLRRALAFQLKQGDPVTPKRVLRALSALYKGPTNFSPVLARWVVDTYAPEGGVVFDPCAGYGGRLLGAMASLRRVRYAGFDIEARTVAGNHKLAEWVGAGDRCSVTAADAVTAVWPSADLVFTGPPYFNRERYGSAADESVRRYSTMAEWIEGFLGTLVEKALVTAPVVVFNIGSIHLDGARHPLPDLLVALAARRGGALDKSWRWELPTFGGKSRDERLLVIRRA